MKSDNIIKASSKDTLWCWGAMMAVLAGAILARAIAYFQGADFWLDEAALYLGLREAAAVTPVTSLSHAAAAPFAIALLYKSLIETFGLNELILRLPAFLASVAGVVVFAVAMLRLLPPVGATAAVILVGLGTEGIIQAAEFKQYSTEFLAATLILIAATRLQDHVRDRRRAWVFALVSIGVLPFSFTAPVIAAACGLGIVIVEMSKPQRADIFQARDFWLRGIIWASAAAAWQILAVEPATRNLFQVNADDYAQGVLSLSRPESLLEAVKVLVSTITVWVESTPLRRGLNLVMLLIWAAGLFLNGRRDIRAHAAFISLMFIVVVLAFAGKLPIRFERQYVFILPLLGYSFGASVQATMEVLKTYSGFGVRWRSGIVAAVTIVALLLPAFAVARAVTHPKGQQVGRLLSRIPAGACPVVWTYYPAWLAVDMYGRRLSGTRYIGERNWPTGNQAADYRRAFQQQINGYDQICLLFSHQVPGESGEASVILSDAETSHACKLLAGAPGTQLYGCEGKAPGRGSAAR